MILRKIFATLGLIMVMTTAQAQDIPLDAGLPLAVQAGVALVEMEGFDENAGTFEATVDLRLRWRDGRLARTDGNMLAPPLTLRNEAAAERLAQIWVPDVVITNQIGDASKDQKGLRIFADGTVEVLRRVTAVFKVDVNMDRFPFDRQKLTIEAVIDDRSINEVVLKTAQSDLDFSSVSRNVSLSGWRVGLIDITTPPSAGWYSTSAARLVATVDITREPGLAVASMLIPLVASLLIPLLALWLNRLEEGVFQVDAFELVNIVIGGFFAVIALNFTVLSSYPALVEGNNAVMRLLTLNYGTLAIALVISILFARFGVLANSFGLFIQEQTYKFLMWALPVSLAAIIVAILGVAYV
jgi:hypothetical protein